MRPLSHTIFTGRQLQHVVKLDSTNRFMRDLVAEKQQKIPEGFIVTADEQFSGKGQRDSVWLSEPGKNLTFSILLRPNFLHPGQMYVFNKAIACGVRDAVSDFISGDSVTIKWPNDIYAGNRKIAGILIENSINSGALQQSIVGIGVNVNQTVFEKWLPNPTSVAVETGVEADRQQLLEGICSRIEFYYLRLRSGDLMHVHEQYKRHLFGRGKTMIFQTGAESIRGTVEDVTPDGNLLLRINDVFTQFEVRSIQWLF